MSKTALFDLFMKNKENKLARLSCARGWAKEAMTSEKEARRFSAKRAAKEAKTALAEAAWLWEEAWKEAAAWVEEAKAWSLSAGGGRESSPESEEARLALVRGWKR